MCCRVLIALVRRVARLLRKFPKVWVSFFPLWQSGCSNRTILVWGGTCRTDILLVNEAFASACGMTIDSIQTLFCALLKFFTACTLDNIQDRPFRSNQISFRAFWRHVGPKSGQCLATPLKIAVWV